MCFKLKSKGETDTTTKINLITEDDAKYHVQAKINNIVLSAYIYIYFGTACNLLKLEKALTLNLTIDKQKNIVVQGYGGAVIRTIRHVAASLTVDDVTRKVARLTIY